MQPDFHHGLPGAGPASKISTTPFDVTAPSEVVAIVRAGCARCDWGESGREAAALRVSVDGKYSQHLLLVRGEQPVEYRMTLGAVGAGHHRLTIATDRQLSARGTGRVTIAGVDVTVLSRRDEGYLAQSMAPILHARPNTVGRFTDLPILMWYEVVPTPRGRQFRYSVIFTNEDGGTSTDRLMATWGRTTDIELVYGVEVDAVGQVLAQEFQGPGHEVPAFKGRHAERHPLLWVSTDNNMVSESGPTRIRYAPAPEPFDLTNQSREVVMDRHPWSYTATAAEMKREGKIVDAATAGSGKIPDLRRYVHVEACTELENVAVAFSVRAADASGSARWYDSDRGLPEFRIVRTGCFRGAVPLPASTGQPDAIRFRAYSRPPPKGGTPAPQGSVRLTRVNGVFTLDDVYLPRPSMFSWTGGIVLPVDGDWRELPFAERQLGSQIVGHRFSGAGTAQAVPCVLHRLDSYFVALSACSISFWTRQLFMSAT